MGKRGGVGSEVGGGGKAEREREREKLHVVRHACRSEPRSLETSADTCRYYIITWDIEDGYRSSILCLLKVACYGIIVTRPT